MLNITEFYDADYEAKQNPEGLYVLLEYCSGNSINNIVSNFDG